VARIEYIIGTVSLGYVAAHSFRLGGIVLLRNIAVTAAAILAANKVLDLASKYIASHGYFQDVRPSLKSVREATGCFTGFWVGMKIAQVAITKIPPATVAIAVAVACSYLWMGIRGTNAQIPTIAVAPVQGSDPLVAKVNAALFNPDWTTTNEWAKTKTKKEGVLQISGMVGEPNGKYVLFLTTDDMPHMQKLLSHRPKKIAVQIDKETQVFLDKELIDDFHKFGVSVRLSGENSRRKTGERPASDRNPSPRLSQSLATANESNIKELYNTLRKQCLPLGFQEDQIATIMNLLPSFFSDEVVSLVIHKARTVLTKPSVEADKTLSYKAKADLEASQERVEVGKYKVEILLGQDKSINIIRHIGISIFKPKEGIVPGSMRSGTFSVRNVINPDGFSLKTYLILQEIN
jgi:hypothetical protein